MTSDPGEKKVILSIDDIPSNLIAIKNILEPMFDVRLVKDGTQALPLLRREKIDLVLLDIEMPKFNGFELLQAIRGDLALASIPVIFVTSHASAAVIRRAVREGANGYVLKPFKPSLLLQKVLEQLGLDAPTAGQDNTWTPK